jgi:hypothetical protein
LTVDVSNINIHLPVPEGGLINNWHTAMSSDNTAVSLDTKDQDMSVDLDFRVKLFSTQEGQQDPPQMSLFNGHLKADVSKIDLFMSIGLRTQEAEFMKSTGMKEAAENAPAISIERLDLSANASASHISVTGGVTEFVIQELANLFRKTILTKLLSEVKYTMQNTLLEKINEELLQYGTHYETAGLGLDFSQIRSPEVANDTLLSLFMNGTFYSESAQEQDTYHKQIKHEDFEVVEAGMYDLMAHIPETTMLSLLNSWTSTTGGANLTELFLHTFDHQFMVDSVCYLNEDLCMAYQHPDEEKLNWSVFLDHVYNASFEHDRINVQNATLRIQFNDIEGRMLMNYTLENVIFAINVTARPEYAQVLFCVDHFYFIDSHVDN